MLVHHILDPSMHLNRDILNLHCVHDSSNFSSDTPDMLLLVLSQLLVFSLILLLNAHLESEQLVLDVDNHFLVLFTGFCLLPGALCLARLLGRDVHELVLDLIVVQGLRVIQIRHKLILVVQQHHDCVLKLLFHVFKSEDIELNPVIEFVETEETDVLLDSSNQTDDRGVTSSQEHPVDNIKLIE